MLHEGLADFLTFASTGNACLGESICPENSYICVVQNQCLRSADNDYTYTSADLPDGAHLRSQFISGYLWDLVTKDGLGEDLVTTLLLQAIDLFVTNSGYTHLVLGLLLVDESSYGGQYCETIYNRAIDRGLEEFISGIDCNNVAEIVTNNGGQLANETPVATPTETSDSKRNSCGSIGIAGQGGVSLLFFALIPLLLRLRRDS